MIIVISELQWNRVSSKSLRYEGGIIMSELDGITVFRIGGDPYTREDLMKMEPVCLRALLRERVHHTIEVEIYPIMLGRKKMPDKFGLQAELIMDVWTERGFSAEDEDLDWCKRYIALAAEMRAGRKVELKEILPTPFTDDQMEVVRRLIWERRSIRDWLPKPVPEGMIQHILEAGRAAPTGCNMDIVRFVVIRDTREAKMVWSDIPTRMDQCVLIVVCYDARVYPTVGHDKLVPHNIFYDCAAAADHMCLMAHALGLGAVWLSCTEKTAKNFQKKYGLPDYIKQALHIAVGWAAVGSIKSLRMPLSEMIIKRQQS
jgi:nitroreductase